MKIFSVVEITHYIKKHLDKDKVLQNCIVQGEVISISHSRQGHYYITLGDEKKVILKTAFFLNRIYEKHRKLLKTLQNGNVIVAKGKISVYAPHGNYQLIIEDFDLVKDEGYWKRLFDKRYEKLQREGLFEERYKKKLPYFPKRIAIITSLMSTAAARKDIYSVLAKRNPAVQIYTVHSSVQGENAPEELIRAFDYVEKYLPFVETIILTRGGGSIEDLRAFNDENLVRRIFRCKIPVISAVGHERDFTLCDYVADKRAATPTAAATAVAPEHQELVRELERLKKELEFAKNTYFEKHNKFLTEAKKILYRELQKRLLVQRKELEYSRENLSHAVVKHFKLQKNLLKNLREALNRFREKPLYLPEKDLSELQKRLFLLRSSLLSNLRRYHGSLLVGLQNSLRQTTENLLNNRKNILRQSFRSLQNLRENSLREIRETRQQHRRNKELLAEIILHKLEMEKKKTEHLHKLLTLADPRQFWKQGFVIVEQKGKRIPAKKKFNPRAPFKLIWHDGEIEMNCE